METYDVIVVGSGMNSLVCSALLAKAGKRVAVLERNDRLGGCIRTDELFPGFTHDVLSSWYPLFTGGPGYAELADDLAGLGLDFANTDRPTAVLTDEGEALVLSIDREENVRRLEAVHPGEGGRFAAAMDAFLSQNADVAFGLLGSEPVSAGTVRLLLGEARKRGLGGTTAFFGQSLEPARAWLERDFRSDLARALIAPWVLHAGLGPDDAYSGVMAQVITAALEMGGLPVVAGGSERIVAMFQWLVESRGGTMRTGVDVEAVEVTDGRAVGVRAAGGAVFTAREAVVCNVTPTQLYGRLLADRHVPDDIAARAAAYRYGRADMQIHFALTAPPQWSAPELGEVPLFHLSGGLDAVSEAVNEAERGLLPQRATVVVGQPTVLDPGRAPEGGWILWIQLQELPRVIRGDAAGEIEVPDGGAWTETVREAYADRIQARLAAHISNLDQAVLGRRVYSPADLEAMNVNLVGGDPYSGACTIDQFLMWRPFSGLSKHRTPVKGLYHIGASTHPGPGLGGNSGYLVAKQLS